MTRDERPWAVVHRRGEGSEKRCWYRSTADELASTLGRGWIVQRRSHTRVLAEPIDLPRADEVTDGN